MDEIEKPQDVENDSASKHTHTTANRNEVVKIKLKWILLL